MPAIPLPFIVALLLGLLLVRLLRRNERQLQPASYFVGACAALALIVGLRWEIDTPAFRFLRPVAAAALPGIAWLCFAGLRGVRAGTGWWSHGLAVVVAIALSASWPLWRPPVDILLASLYLGYGIALLRLARGGPDGFAAARLGDATSAQKAACLAGMMLCLSALVDLAVAADFEFFQGRHAVGIVAGAQMLVLLLVSIAVTAAGKVASADAVTERDVPPSEHDPDEDRRIVETLQTLLRGQQLYRDPDLTLNRLARRAGIPARRISAAVNRVLARNLSQMVNDIRIEEACRLLRASDLPVTQIMFDAGFQTKSNFNREFLRVTGKSPSAFRRENAGSTGAAAAMAWQAPSPEMR